MAKTNLGLSMEVDITLTNTGEKEASKLVQFLESHGIEELSRTKTAHGFLSIELTADEMFPSWDQLRGALNSEFPQYNYVFSEGTEDNEDDEYSTEYESLSIYD